MDSSTTSFGYTDFRSSLRGRRRLSLASSFSSHDSNGSSGGGGKQLKIRTSSGISCRTDPLWSGGRNKHQGKENHSALLAVTLGRYASLPVIRNRQARHGRHSDAIKGTSASNKNEEWDLSTPQTMARDLRRTRNFLLQGQGRNPAQNNDLAKPSNNNNVQPQRLQSCFKKNSKRTHSNKKEIDQSVAFAAPQDIGNSRMDDPSLWYTPSDHDRFLSDATVRANLTDRTMRYVAHTERTYNSSTGLVPPQVLHEYLSSPEEIIGLEHLLKAQKMARESLRSHHVKALLREQDCQKRLRELGRQSDDVMLLKLAESLRSSSTIAAHMAQERASFVRLL